MRCETTLAWALALIGSVSWSPVARADETCVPACRTGFTCLAAKCVSACNPECRDDQVCSVGPSGFDCVSRKEESPQSAPPAKTKTLAGGDERCEPRCATGEGCMETSKGFVCIAGASMSERRPVRSDGPRLAPKDERYSEAWRSPQPAPIASAPSSTYNYAKPAAITLGVLLALGGVINFAAASEVSESAPLIIGGFIGLTLGAWGITAGVVSD